MYLYIFNRIELTKPALHRVYLCLGTNLGDRSANLEQAIERIKESCGAVCGQSSVWASSAWGYQSENEFYNQCLEIETRYAAHELIDKLLCIENEMGRIRDSISYKDRLMDIDILFFDDLVVQSKKLILPHPRIAERRFVLAPMKELAPDYIHPVIERSISVLLEECRDKGVVMKMSFEGF